MDLNMIASLLCPAVTLLTLCYAALCAVSPFGTCRRCSGTGRIGGRQGLRSRPCRRCDATGIRIRLGRHLFNQAARLHRDHSR